MRDRKLIRLSRLPRQAAAFSGISRI